MSKIINVKNFGDYWNNQHEVEQQLSQVDVTERVVFYCWEGISIVESGLLDFVVKWQKKTRHSADKIAFRSVNRKEQLPYPNISNESNAIWGPGNRSWWQTPVDFANNPTHLFGLFVGRSTVARNVMLYECYTNYNKHFLFSRLNQRKDIDYWYDPTDHIQNWVNSDHIGEIINWWNNLPIESIDQRNFSDQFQSAQNTTAIGLLKYYDHFAVELIPETMTRGITFFPTEKTVRAIAGTKPFLIYASKNFLKYLRNLGFQTFGDLWDESYDQFEGPERWQQMKKVVQYIINCPQLVEKAQEVAEYNKRLLITKPIHKDPNA